MAAFQLRQNTVTDKGILDLKIAAVAKFIAQSLELRGHTACYAAYYCHICEISSHRNKYQYQRLII